MEAGTPGSDVFKFLDIRSPRILQARGPKYVVGRKDLRFAETALERELRDALKPPAVADANAVTSEAEPETTYTQKLRKIVAHHSRDLAAEQYSAKFFGDVADYDEVLSSTGLSPEAVVTSMMELYQNRKGIDSEEDYLLSPLGNAWDRYVLAYLTLILGGSVSDEMLAALATILRVGAAVSFAARSDQDADLRPYAIASISIDLVDTELLRKERPSRAPAEVEKFARERQNALVHRLAERALAAREILEQFNSGRVRVTKLAPRAESVIAAAGDTATSFEMMPLEVDLPADGLSERTRAILQQYGSPIDDGWITGVSLERVLKDLDATVSSAGLELFRGAGISQIAQFEPKLQYLQERIREGAVPEVSELDRLPLLIRPPGMGAAPVYRGDTSTTQVRPLGIGDLKVVKQNIRGYELGEVGHIENILEGQEKERLHAVRQKTEETLTIEHEKSTSSEKDLQTTDRFELTEESQSTVEEKRQNESGVTVTASYGPVSISANTKFQDSSSHQQSSKVSRNFVKEVVNRTVEKVQQRVREERIRKSTLEIEETNRYKLAAAAGKNVVGIYRWVDKVYWAQVHSYGKRLMLEFMVPEPAALFIFGQAVQPPAPNAVMPPEPLTIGASDVKRWNYATLASKYGASVELPPPSIEVSHHTSRSAGDQAASNIQLADGRVARMGGVSAAWVGPADCSLHIILGTVIWDTKKSPWYAMALPGNSSGTIPLLVVPFKTANFSVAAYVASAPSDFAFEQWQLGVYKALQEAYQLRLSEYQTYLERQRGSSEDKMSQLSDAANRAIERRELQRSCIEILTQQHFQTFGAVQPNPSTGWPEIDFDDAAKQGRSVQFFHHSFEWEQMTYLFYPYFWARQLAWPSLLVAAGTDQLFASFLSSGFARVVVPVRPAHESDVLFYLLTGIQWSGSEPPVIGDSLYVSIVDEIKESLDAPDTGVAEGDPWQFKIPTSLVLLDGSGNLPSWPEQMPAPPLFTPSQETCNGVPYNAAQWKDNKTIADAIRKLGYQIESGGDQGEALKKARPSIRALQSRFNTLGSASIVGRQLAVDGRVGPCTLRALTYFDALRAAGKWPGTS